MKSFARFLPLLLLLFFAVWWAWPEAPQSGENSTSSERAEAAAPSIVPGAPVGAPEPSPQEGSGTNGEGREAVAAAPAPADLEPISAFAEWTEGYMATWSAALEGGPAVAAELLDEGRELARVRRPQMLKLMRENPWRALTESVALHEWVALPAELQAMVEEPFSGLGDYEVRSDCRAKEHVGSPDRQTRFLTIDDETLAAFVYGRREALLSKNAIPVQGIRFDGQAALWENPVLELEPGDHEVALKLFERGDPESSLLTGEPLAAGEGLPSLSGGAVHYFAANEERSRYSNVIAALENQRGPNTVRDGMRANAPGGESPNSGDGPPPQGESGWANTPKDQLVLRVVYSGQATSSHPYTQQELITAYAGASSSFSTQSFGKTELNTTVAPQVFVLPEAQTYYENPPGNANGANLLRDDARTLATAAGINLADFDLVAYWFPSTGGDDFDAPAFADIEGEHSWYDGPHGSRTESIIVHEGGHNYGLGHANGWDGYTGTGLLSRLDNAENDEYGDVFDLMGSDFGSVNGTALYTAGHFDMNGKSFLRWIDEDEVHSVTQSGVYRIHRFDHVDADNFGNKLALRCCNANGDPIWIGLRQNFSETAGKATIVWAFRPHQHRLIDTTPLSTIGSNLEEDREDAALTVGQTWVDPSQTLRVTNLGTGGSSPSEYIDVQISLVDASLVSFFTDNTGQTGGLTGSYVNQNLRGSSDTDWTDGSPTIAGTRVDAPVEFADNGWGARAPLNLTGGTDDNWDNFSVQWDGYVRISRKAFLATVSDDSSRMWIDTDNSGGFSASELVDNNWGSGQGATQGDLSGVLDPGLYRIRVQYEEGNGGNSFNFAASELLFEAYTSPAQTTRGLTGRYIDQNLRGSSDQDWTDGTPTVAGTRIEYPFFPGNGWGSRSSVGITGGADDKNWDDYSVEWDGGLVLGRVPMRFATISDDSSRMWIDVGTDGVYDNTLPDLADNGWGSSQGTTIGPLNGPVPDLGWNWIRIQFEEGAGGNNFRLVGIPDDPSDDHGSSSELATLLPGTDNQLEGVINFANDRDFFRIDLPGPGRLRVYSLGGVDTFGTLRDAGGAFIASADDINGSYNRNFEFETDLAAGGSYTIEVRGFDSAELGGFDLVTEFFAGTPIGGGIEQPGLTFEPGQNRLVTPASVTQTAGDAIIPGYEPQNLINNSGLSATPNSDASDYTAITHSTGFGSGTWATNSGDTPNYFNGTNPAPQFVFNLGALYELSALVIWGYAGINNEASNFTVEFSQDGGVNYYNRRFVQTGSLLGNDVGTLDFGPLLRANTVRITMTDNAGGRGFSGAGTGDRVGLSEVKFLGTSSDRPWRGQTDMTLDGIDAARSDPSIGNNEESSFAWNLTEGGTLSWWWKVSSETSFDFLEFHLDGVMQFRISGEVDWQLRTVEIPAGNHTAMWRYAKDGSVTHGADAGWVDQVSFVPSNDGGADSPGRNFTFAGDANWFSQSTTTYDGVDALESGDIVDLQTSRLETSVSGPARVAFQWKVSSEAGFDPLVFLVDGDERARISGTQDWQRQTLDLGAGQHTLAWEYRKDSSVSSGSDAGWIDVLTVNDLSLRPQVLSGIAGIDRIEFTSQPGASYALDYSTDCQTWIRILNEIPSQGSQTTIDIPAPLVGLPKAFFRLVH